jgi:fatty acid desaturase
MPATEIRAADTDRSAVAEVLGRALQEGRLTVAEYDERLAAAYAARTHADLAPLTADLPTPAPRPAEQRATYGSCGGGDLRQAWRGYLTVAFIVWAVYLTSSLAGGFSYPWPVWVVGPWGAVLLARTLTTRGALARRS